MSRGPLACLFPFTSCRLDLELQLSYLSLARCLSHDVKKHGLIAGDLTLVVADKIGKNLNVLSETNLIEHIKETEIKTTEIRLFMFR